MQKSKVTLTEQLEAFRTGNILDWDGTENSNYCNFYDWYCPDHRLNSKARVLFKKVEAWVKKRNTITDNVYCYFANKDAGKGKRYDMFYIVEIGTDRVIWVVVPRHSVTKLAEVYVPSNYFLSPVYTSKSFTSLLNLNF